MFPTLQSKQNQGEKDGQNLSLEPSLSFEANTENSITDDSISSSASETTEKVPKFHNFIPIPVIDRLQSNLVNKFVPRTHHESEEVSTELKLGLYDPWVMKKKITVSDIDSLSRLLIAKDLVKEHILPQWDTSFIEGIKDGIAVAVWDFDTKTEHQLRFKQWSSNGSYVFNGMWNQDFVSRRQLKVGDEIGLFWDQSNSRLNFSVLNRASSN
ncbi:B3 domain-containing protein At2g33720-like [Quercus lobata]|uniref:B3 domain-containing protein n=1 Tax=Quercus lobata TaxID=97700 RepID=A0A7N2MEB3_QUELO|nr:B3 domain-containing protein At2g33720-like [Quercus lobata]